MTAAACQKASRQLEQQLQRIFVDWHKTGQLDLEAAETAIRSTVHQTGADKPGSDAGAMTGS
jgi:hypothetical protein